MDFRLVLTAALIGGFGGALGALVMKLVTKKGKDGRIAFAVVPGVVAGTLATSLHWDQRLAEVLFPKNPRDRITEASGKAITSDPAFAEYMRGKPDVRAAAQELSSRGLRRLDANEMRSAASIRLRLAELSPDVCTAMWTRAGDPASLADAVNRLTDRELEQLTDLTTRASLRELHGQGEVLTPPADRSGTIASAAKALGERGDSLTRTFEAGASASAAAQCEAMKGMLEAVGKLPDDQARQVFALILGVS